MLYGKEHVQRYQETDGAEGHDWNDTTVLLLTTKGRKSGNPYTTPLIYQESGDDYVVVASKGGDPDHPEWYKNLQATPDVQVQVKADKFAARARTATEEERAQLWPLMTRTWPDYDEYQKKTDRQIPVVVLERTR
ncbi:nitroreductase family deazaflavin-dependent oxidoreductase [Nonomuraea sp. NN258]|uniref:nitroreductase family deazaflavin-dependent oxidoreductase n=1 Tax=Nonomuraea antri TaxID=2730852 RepID=UPI0015698896|nr:nitroreductase family deazaflavin-dependent oxidoreductase [Nonomuraea antri]NRQ39229.1 nitroreductase family deazaflavin-dependent oxidoreductase [Nonomuraea antri]